MEHIAVIIKRIVKNRIIKSLIIFFMVLLVCAVIFIPSFATHCSSRIPDFKPIHNEIVRNQEMKEIEYYVRSEDSTYLTFPEWYLVFNPQEYGSFLSENQPSGFPYFESIGQFWGAYCNVYGIASRHYEFNSGNHLMLGVIGTSFSFEYLVKGVYENTIGKVTEMLSFGQQTEEDMFAARVAQDYGNFIPTTPWFEFPYGESFTGLWKETDLWGKHWVRKWERKMFLSLEYGVKAAYAKLIKFASRSVFGAADTEVFMTVEGVTEDIFEITGLQEIRKIVDGMYIITVPHYQGFTDVVPLLAERGVRFIEIAGNDEILIAAVVDNEWNYGLEVGSVLFDMNLLTTDVKKRVVVQAPVKALGEILNYLRANGTIEHIYDY